MSRGQVRLHVLLSEASYSQHVPVAHEVQRQSVCLRCAVRLGCEEASVLS